MKCRAIGMFTIALMSGTVSTLFGATEARAQTLSGAALVNALKKGGYVLVMRHASSPREMPGERTANPDNTTRERQLDEAGRASAAAMGKALRELAIPIGDVLTSPTYRALETVRLGQLGTSKTIAALGDRGQSMQGVTEADAAWLRDKIKELPKGTNTILVTHMPNLAQAFPQFASGVSDGESLVFGSDGKGGATLVARIRIEEWPGMR
jgi:phosphohistidine phosphatase SixA